MSKGLKTLGGIFAGAALASVLTGAYRGFYDAQGIVFQTPGLEETLTYGSMYLGIFKLRCISCKHNVNNC